MVQDFILSQVYPWASMNSLTAFAATPAWVKSVSMDFGLIDRVWTGFRTRIRFWMCIRSGIWIQALG